MQFKWQRTMNMCTFLHSPSVSVVLEANQGCLHFIVQQRVKFSLVGVIGTFPFDSVRWGFWLWLQNQLCLSSSRCPCGRGHRRLHLCGDPGLCCTVGTHGKAWRLWGNRGMCCRVSKPWCDGPLLPAAVVNKPLLITINKPSLYLTLTGTGTSPWYA